jgi:hypothetical protein
VTASEFSFLALGLILGLVVGAALVEVVRARTPSSHEVRLTVSHDAIPRRAATLADDAYVAVGPEPARGGPGDRRETGTPMPPGASERRTPVRYESPNPPVVPSMAGAIPITPEHDAPMPGRIMEPALPLTGGGQPARSPEPKEDPGRSSISDEDDPVMRGRHDGWDDNAVMDLEATHHIVESAPPWERNGGSAGSGTATAVAMVAAPTAVALLDRPRSKRSTVDKVDTERCVEERRLVEERCELATLARARADVAADALRTAQRTYDGHEAAGVTAAWRADPRAVHEAKEGAQGGFRAAVAAATTPDQLEAAARDWLTEINRINTEARAATAAGAREHAAAVEIGATLERLGLEADAARIGAANADAACLAARVAVADCEERLDTDPSTFLIPPLGRAPAGRPRLDEDERLGGALEAGGEPRIFRLLRGDRQAMNSLVASLAGSDPDARRRWQLQMTALVEAIVADAIEGSALEFPEGHGFWSGFTRTQDRDVVQALSSLGYRFDGLGGWTDGRHPSSRDLSLALGYAGLDPKRVRHWPDEDTVAELFRDVTVAADEYLAGVAGDLTLAEMVTMLGRRADGLAEIWNQWARIRPLLLDETGS